MKINHPHEDKDCQIGWLIENSIKPILEYQIKKQIAKEIETLFCNGSNGCYGVNKEHCDVVKECADIARGQK
jgi:hypothetical protein